SGDGGKAGWRLNVSSLVAPVAMALLTLSLHDALPISALEVAKGALVHPFFSVSAVNEVADLANEAPSSEVKHWALEKLLASTVTVPLCWMCRRPLVALHRSTGT